MKHRSITAVLAAIVLLASIDSNALKTPWARHDEDIDLMDLFFHRPGSELQPTTVLFYKDIAIPPNVRRLFFQRRGGETRILLPSTFQTADGSTEQIAPVNDPKFSRDLPYSAVNLKEAVPYPRTILRGSEYQLKSDPYDYNNLPEPPEYADLPGTYLELEIKDAKGKPEPVEVSSVYTAWRFGGQKPVLISADRATGDGMNFDFDYMVGLPDPLYNRFGEAIWSKENTKRPMSFPESPVLYKDFGKGAVLRILHDFIVYPHKKNAKIKYGKNWLDCGIDAPRVPFCQLEVLEVSEQARTAKAGDEYEVVDAFTSKSGDNVFKDDGINHKTFLTLKPLKGTGIFKIMMCKTKRVYGPYTEELFKQTTFFREATASEGSRYLMELVKP